MELVRHLEFGNRSPRLLVVEPPVPHPPKENECRALKASRLRHDSISSPRSGSPVARLPQPVKGRHKDSRKVGNKNHQNQHPRQGHNNFGAITPAASER